MKASTFLKGAFLGILAGATAGILFAPKAGKETREDIKKKALELKDKAMDMYEYAQKQVMRKAENLKKITKTIDKTAYTQLVDEVVTELKDDAVVTKESAKKLGEQLREDWTKVEKALKS